MGQKVHPTCFRLGYIKTWNFKWYANEKKYAEFLHEDLTIHKFITQKLKYASISNIEVIRYPYQVVLNIFSARPGLIIGKKGQEIEKLKKSLQQFTKKNIHINIHEIHKSFIDASLLSQHIAQQIESRVAYKRIMKQVINNAMKNSAKGIRVMVSGRLGGAEMSRTEQYKEGRIPLHTLRADIDYATAVANTKVGKVGVKVWIFKDEIFKK